MDESIRRYYLDAMGIQCWQLLEAEPLVTAIHVTEAHATDTSEANQNTGHAVAESSAPYNKSTEADVTGLSEISWSQVNREIQQCERCQLHKTREQAIAGRGNQSADIMFILLSASRDDDKAGVLCSGQSEVLFSKMLGAINIAFDDIYITSLLKCSVPVNHTVSPKEIQSCDINLKQQIELIKPKLLVILGETAVQCLLQKNLSLDEYREMNNASAENETALQYDSVPLFVSYSPQELILNSDNKRKAWSDLQQLQLKM